METPVQKNKNKNMQNPVGGFAPSLEKPSQLRLQPRIAEELKHRRLHLLGGFQTQLLSQQHVLSHQVGHLTGVAVARSVDQGDAFSAIGLFVLGFWKANPTKQRKQKNQQSNYKISWLAKWPTN